MPIGSSSLNKFPRIRKYLLIKLWLPGKENNFSQLIAMTTEAIQDPLSVL